MEKEVASANIFPQGALLPLISARSMDPTKKKILVIDDDPTFSLMISTFLSKKGYETSVVGTGKKGLEAIFNDRWDLILVDYKLPDLSGLDILETIKKERPETPSVLITNYADIRTAVRSIKIGAFEYVTKPVRPDELLAVVQRALETSGKETVTSRPKKRHLSPNHIIGEGDLAQQVEETIQLVAPTSLSVLILGQSGTGKEFAAQRIHSLSDRSDQPFVAIDCGALPKDIASAELFGYVKGAFTGASRDHKGHFEMANGGTLFLDEVGNLSYDVQLKLLRTLQQRTVRPVGSDREIPVNVRIIAATNEDLSGAMRNQDFRQDLYHRLNEFSIKLPALRDRPEDLESFAQYFLDAANEELGTHARLEVNSPFFEALRDYSWPGNLRELRNIIRRAALLAQDESLSPTHLPSDVRHFSVQGDIRRSSDPIDLKVQQEEREKQAIIKALEQTRYNKSKAARILNIDRKTLYNKMERYGIKG
ncbi:MAG: sigma-54 dependent transcriptional regulator [Bacteroidota bacterium]|nr:sigma-54 dependent transcriptional regulator [Bacteroidota bacterium]MDX5505866.1 sigma-54 dependent transcriptional regulator [Bacteroidota bacterium]